MTEPFIQWREGMVSRWINSSQLVLVPIDDTIPVPVHIERIRRPKPSDQTRLLVKMAITSVAKEFKVEPWMVKNPSKNTDVQRARGKAAFMLMGLRNDDGTSSLELDEIARVLNFYDEDGMIQAAAPFLPDADDDEWNA
jgi:hypothetical protein